MREPSGPTNTQSQSVERSSTVIEPLRFDVESYRHHITDLNLTEEQQTKLLHTLWQIMVQFVDLGFNIHPVQSATQSKGLSVDVVEIVRHFTSAQKEDKTCDS